MGRGADQLEARSGGADPAYARGRGRVDPEAVLVKRSRNSLWLSTAALLLSATLLSCTSVDVDPPKQAVRAPDVSILVFGDSGYHYDYLEAEDYEIVVTEENFKAKERRDWIEDKRP